MTFHEDYGVHQSWPPLVEEDNTGKILKEMRPVCLICLEHLLQRSTAHLIIIHYLEHKD